MAKVRTTQNKIDEVIDKNVEKFLEGAEKTQRNIYNQLLVLVKDLKTNKDGAIKQTVSNLRTASAIRKIVREIVLNPAYEKRVKSFLRSYDSIEKINNNYLGTIKKTFDPSKEIYRITKQVSLDRMVNSLTDAGIDVGVITPIKDIVDKSITEGAFYTDMVNELREFILDSDQNLGHLRRYASQITWDGIQQFNRSYVLAFAKDTSNEWWRYSSGLVGDSRRYCRKRQGRYFHTKEIEDSASERWSGKIPATNSSTIFRYCGGYNCKHHYTPVLIDVVPRSVIERNIRNGNYNPPKK